MTFFPKEMSQNTADRHAAEENEFLYINRVQRADSLQTKQMR